MSRIVSVGTSVPEHTVTQKEARQFAEKTFATELDDIERLLSVFDNTHIDRRHLSVPLAWFEHPHPPGEKNDLYIEHTLNLTEQAIRRCLKQCGLAPSEIDHIFFISSTGIATPSIDARLCNLLDMKATVKRTPIFGLGCAGGACGLSRACEYVRAFPAERALVVAAELCGLTFMHQDHSKKNLIATSLFADGAAAVLIEGEQVQKEPADSSTTMTKPVIIDSTSIIWKDSLDVMGWEIDNDGWRVVFSSDIPRIVEERVAPEVKQFLQKHNLTVQQIGHFIAHPGGWKVIQAYRNGLQLTEDHLEPSQQVLKNFGNMSSPTVFFVLEEVLKKEIDGGEYGLITALGPGFSGEMLLVRWQ